MRVMTYNIKTGGGSRLGRIADVVNEVAPDLLCLQELRGFTRRRSRLAREFAASIGMRPYLTRGIVGQ
ncbi:MAG TPA: endonuclease/exonuclease/phosphatase family protein, partial [Catenuloplanes sp.]